MATEAERLAALERLVYGQRGYTPGASTGAETPGGVAHQARFASVGPVVLGDTRDWDHDPIVLSPELEHYTKVPAYYPVVGTLGGEDGARITLATQLRPEPFVLKRITWATDGDLIFDGTQADPADVLKVFASWSQQGRSVECRFGDSFTNFSGPDFGLVSAMFGDSQGFMDVPGTLLFQGSQQLQVELRRIQWPYQQVTIQPLRENTKWDFIFAGVSLLPPGVNQSGSAG